MVKFLIGLVLGVVMSTLTTIWLSNSSDYNSTVNRLSNKTTLVTGWDKQIEEGDIRMDQQFSQTDLVIKFKNENDAKEFNSKLREFIKSTRGQ